MRHPDRRFQHGEELGSERDPFAGTLLQPAQLAFLPVVAQVALELDDACVGGAGGCTSGRWIGGVNHDADRHAHVHLRELMALLRLHRTRDRDTGHEDRGLRQDAHVQTTRIAA